MSSLIIYQNFLVGWFLTFSFGFQIAISHCFSVSVFVSPPTFWIFLCVIPPLPTGMYITQTHKAQDGLRHP